MSRYVLSPRAQQDLDEIWNYTAKTWGERQAEAYMRLLQRAIETVADDPRRGHPALFYRAVDAGIDIVRILHSRMNFERHL
jgi:toxin ParE1/3/4